MFDKYSCSFVFCIKSLGIEVKVIEGHFQKDESFSIMTNIMERKSAESREVKKLAQYHKVNFNFRSMMLECEATNTYWKLIRLPESLKPFLRLD